MYIGNLCLTISNQRAERDQIDKAERCKVGEAERSRTRREKNCQRPGRRFILQATWIFKWLTESLSMTEIKGRRA